MKLALLSAVLVLLGLAGIMVSTVLRVHEYYIDEQIDYGIILDAGSTSTKAYIFEWRHKISIDVPIVSISMTSDKKPLMFRQKPGLATLAPNYTQVGDYLDPILKWAHQNVPDSAKDTTPIYLRGTGGLRELTDFSANTLLTSVRFKLQESGFYFDNSFASVITPKQEAGYGFLAVNTLYNKLQTRDDVESLTQYGSLDLGGVSSNIAFVTQGNIPANYSYTTDVNGTMYTIFSQGLDGFGINDARFAFNSSLLLNSSGNIVQDPCAPSGYYENVTLSSPHRSFLLMGSSNSDQCKQSIQELVSTMTKSLSTVNVGSTRFVVADHYLEVKDFFNLKDNANLLELDARTSSFCSLNYGDAMDHHKKYQADVQKFCFMGNYIVTLLTQYYGLNPTLRHISWRQQVKNTPITWTLGAMLDHVNSMTPDTSPQTRTRYVRFFTTNGGMVVLFTSVLLAIMGLVLFILQRRRRTDDYVLIQ